MININSLLLLLLLQISTYVGLRAVWRAMYERMVCVVRISINSHPPPSSSTHFGLQFISIKLVCLYMQYVFMCRKNIDGLVEHGGGEMMMIFHVATIPNRLGIFPRQAEKSLAFIRREKFSNYLNYTEGSQKRGRIKPFQSYFIIINVSRFCVNRILSTQWKRRITTLCCSLLWVSFHMYYCARR